MKNLSLLLPLAFAVPACAADLDLVRLPATQALALTAVSAAPEDYAAAYGRFVGFYAQPARAASVIFPQMSAIFDGERFAAIGFRGDIEPAQGVQVLRLPSCEFVYRTYVGNYPGIGPMIQALIAEAQQQGFAVSSRCGIRIRHLNSPDNTQADQLVHEVLVPVAKNGR